jgi:hypothetical protein
MIITSHDMCRVRILEELEAGAIFSLWKSTVGRYVLDEQRSKELFSDFFIWDDFPSQPGEVGRWDLVSAGGSPDSGHRQ